MVGDYGAEWTGPITYIKGVNSMAFPQTRNFTVRVWPRLVAWFFLLFSASASLLCLYGIFDIFRDGNGYAVLTLVVPALALFVFGGWSWLDTVSMRLVLAEDAFEYSDLLKRRRIPYESVSYFRTYMPSVKTGRREIEIITKEGKRYVIGNSHMNDKDELLGWLEESFRMTL